MFHYIFRPVVLSSASVALLLLSVACLTRVSPGNVPTPDINVEQTVEAAVSATIAAIPPPTPLPTPSQAPTPTRRPVPTATAVVVLTITPTATPTPVPDPLETIFRRIFNSSGENPPQFQVKLRNLTDRVIVEFGLEICPKGSAGQPVADRESGKVCFVVSGESIFQPINARPPTGYVQILDGLYEKDENGQTLQWAISRYPSWVGTGYESATRADVTLTYVRFQNGDVWERGVLTPPPLPE